MKVKQIVTISAGEVLAALQATYPALCEGTGHTVYKIDYKGNPDGDPLKPGKGAIILSWESDNEIKLEKG